MAEARWVTDPQPFADLEPFWNDLLARCENPNPFLSWDWAAAWWRHLGAGELNCLTLWRGADLEALAPVYRAAGPWGLRTLRLLGSGQADYLDFLVRQGHGDELYAELLAKLWAPADCDLAYLEQVPGARLERLRAQARASGAYLQIKPRGHCYTAALPARWEDYLATLGSNDRYNIGRRTRALERQHDVVFRRITAPGAELERQVERFFTLMVQRLEMRGRQLALPAERSLAFHRELAQRFARRGWLNLCLLERRGEPIATLFVFEYGRTLYYYHSGFDPDWSKYSVGTVLLAKCIQDGIARGLREFDFTRGRAAYKAKWQVQERAYYRVALARSGWSHLRFLGHGAWRRLARNCRRARSAPAAVEE